MTQDAMRVDKVTIMSSPNLNKLRDNLALKKVCSFEDVERQPGKIVIIRHIKTGDKSQNRPWTERKNYHDPEENIYYGFPMGIDNKTGEYKWNKMIIDGELVLDLTDKFSCQIYEFWRNSPNFTGSKLQKKYNTEATLMVYDEQEEVEHIYNLNVTKNELRAKIAGMKDEQVKLYGLVFNVDPAKNDVTRIKNILYERIEKDAEYFKKLDSNETKLRVRAILNKAILLGVIQQNTITNEITYSGKLLGSSKQAAEIHLESNHGLFNEIYSAVASRDKVFNSDEQMTESVNYNAEIKNLKAALKEKDAVVQELTSKMDKVLELIEKQAKVVAPAASTETASETDQGAEDSKGSTIDEIEPSLKPKGKKKDPNPFA